MAEKAISTATVIGFLSKKSPVNWDPSGVSQDRLDHAPSQKYKQHVEENEEDDIGRRLEIEHVLKHKNEVVEADEHNDPDKVGID